MSATILYIHHGKGIGGAALSLLYLVSNLDRTKYNPIVLFLHDSAAIELFIQRGITVCGPVNVGDFSHTKIWWFAWYHLPYMMRALFDTGKTLCYVARRWLRIIRPDMVHLNTSTLLAWGVVAKRMGIPVVWHVREPLAPGYFGLRRFVVRSCIARYADLIMPICKHDAKPWAGLPKTQVVYNAVEPETFSVCTSTDQFIRTHNLDPKRRYILFLGGLSAQKGTLTILRAMQRVVRVVPDAVLLLAGSLDTISPHAWSPRRYFPADRYRKKVMALLGTLGSSVALVGTITDVPAAMAASSMVVFPASVGHFARPVIEAGFMRKPVIASACAPLDELVVHEQTGLLVHPRDVAAWADAVVRLLHDQAYAQQLGDAAYAMCTKSFGVNQQIDTIQMSYQKLLAHKVTCV